jgi:hypothetical protein
VKRLYRNPKEFFMPPRRQAAELENSGEKPH